MSGICGFYHPDSKIKADQEIVDLMGDSLSHRGKDSEGIYLNQNLGMGVRRLAIVDISGGQQPAASEDGTVVVVFNGEIYNFRELRSELESLGHVFKTRSDTEVIVHAYEQWEYDALDRFNGMFAFSLWDARRRRLVLARDRMGKKPLYWTYSRRGLIWASEAKALLAVPWVERHINPTSLHHYLTLQYTPDPQTIYEGIFQLPAAHKLVIWEGGYPRVSRWWQLSYLPKHLEDQPEIIERTKSMLREAVQRRLLSDAPPGILLNHRMDSAILAALMAEASSRPVKAFTLNFADDQNSGFPIRQVIQRYEMDHQEYVFRLENLPQIIESVIYAIDEPFADPMAIPLFELTRQAGECITSALDDDGSKETLAGDLRYLADKNLIFSLPRWVNRRSISASLSRLPGSDLSENGRGAGSRKRWGGQASKLARRGRLERWIPAFTHQEKLDLYVKDWHKDLSQSDTLHWIGERYDMAFANSHLDRKLYSDIATYLPGDVLPRIDRTSMAHSLEIRSPYLDDEWVVWTARLPERYKVMRGQAGWLLQAAFGDLIPSPPARGGQSYLRVPIGSWLRQELRDWARQRLTGNPRLDEFFRPEVVRAMLEEHQDGKADHGIRLWTLLMFAIWLEHYL